MVAFIIKLESPVNFDTMIPYPLHGWRFSMKLQPQNPSTLTFQSRPLTQSIESTFHLLISNHQSLALHSYEEEGTNSLWTIKLLPKCLATNQSWQAFLTRITTLSTVKATIQNIGSTNWQTDQLSSSLHWLITWKHWSKDIPQ